MDLRVRRLEQGLTLKQLAERCRFRGVSVSTAQLSRIERSLHIPRPALRKALAELLDVPIRDFDDWP